MSDKLYLLIDQYGDLFLKKENVTGLTLYLSSTDWLMIDVQKNYLKLDFKLRQIQRQISNIF